MPPTAEQQQRYGPRRCSTRCTAVVEPDPAARPPDAAGLRRRAAARQRHPVPVPRGRRVVNPTVAALRGLYRHSGVGNAGNRGLDDAFAQDTYVLTRLDTELLPAIVAAALDVVVLSGQPGRRQDVVPGPSVGAALTRAGAVELHDDAAGWRRRLGGRTFAAVYDASESHGELSSDDLFHQAFDPGPAAPGSPAAPCSSPPTTAGSRSSAPTTPTATRR